MVRAELVCHCGFSFEETFLDDEVSKAEDLERFYIRCPRCGEEAGLRSLGPAAPKKWHRQKDES